MGVDKLNVQSNVIFPRNHLNTVCQHVSKMTSESWNMISSDVQFLIIKWHANYSKFVPKPYWSKYHYLFLPDWWQDNTDLFQNVDIHTMFLVLCSFCYLKFSRVKNGLWVFLPQTWSFLAPSCHKCQQDFTAQKHWRQFLCFF